LLEGPVVDSVEGGFVAEQEWEGDAGAGELVEHEAEAAGVVDFRELLGDLLFGEGEFVDENGGFEVGDAAEAPAEDGEGADELAFEGGGGAVGVLKRGEEGVEDGLVLVGEGLEGGAESVLAGVLRGAGFAFGGDWPTGFGAVLAGCVGFRFRFHDYGSHGGAGGVGGWKWEEVDFGRVGRRVGW